MDEFFELFRIAWYNFTSKKSYSFRSTIIIHERLEAWILVIRYEACKKECWNNFVDVVILVCSPGIWLTCMVSRVSVYPVGCDSRTWNTE